MPPKFLRRFVYWYYTRIYVHVRPERIYVWPGGNLAAEPELFDAHLEEVRSGHAEEPADASRRARRGQGPPGTSASTSSGRRFRTAVVSLVAPDGFPVLGPRARRAPTAPRGVIRLGGEPARGAAAARPRLPDRPRPRPRVHLADATSRSAATSSRRATAGRSCPHKLVGGFVVPRGRRAMLSENWRKAMRFRRIARRELARRESTR